MDAWTDSTWNCVFLYPTGRIQRVVDFTASNINPLVVSSGINIGSLLNRMGKILFIAAIAFCLFADSRLSTREWYSHEVEFSDWRGIPPVDYSTNVPLSNWYSGHSAKYLRQENLKQFLSEPDTVMLGIDYYGFYKISCNVASGFQAQWIIDTLMHGGVLVTKSYKGKLFFQRKK